MRGTPIGVLAISVLLLAGCGEKAQLAEQSSQGPDPQIPAPRTGFIPTVKQLVDRILTGA